MREELTRDVEIVGRITAIPRILHVVSATTGLRFAAVARVTNDEWVACAVRDEVGLGLSPGAELDVATTLCQDVRDTMCTVVMDHADEDDRYKDHPTPKMYGFQSYISVPIFRHGEYFGTLCALDPNPAALKNEKTLEMFALFADLIGRQLEDEEARAAGEAALLDARQTGELREQFIAVLGHDLRTPVSSISLGVEQLLRTSRSEAEVRTLERIRSSGRRIAALVDSVMDFARARLGGGFALDRTAADLGVLAHRVVEELLAAHPDRTVAVSVDGDVECLCDVTRVSQLLSNLVGNAIEHAPHAARVAVSVVGHADEVVVRVDNDGPPLDPGVVPHLFRPFFRGRAPGSRDGLGLGLYIASQIVAAHRGQLDVDARPTSTGFVVRLPRS